VPLRRVSPWLVKATVAIEDRRFYEHGGLDIEGIARALWENVKAFQVVQGGSTITQQLVRNLYPVSRERTVERKLEEACLAIKLNRAWSKERILSTYLNQVYYGNLAYGVEAAAQTYYSRPARALSIAQAALLAATRCCSRCSTTTRSTRDSTAPQCRDRSACGRAASTSRSASPTSSATSATC
jgi:membrane peptidoglycan carboxypeptidase